MILAAENSTVDLVTEKYTLDNGLTVILEENHASSVVAVNVWVKVGSACEGEGEHGLAVTDDPPCNAWMPLCCEWLVGRGW